MTGDTNEIVETKKKKKKKKTIVEPPEAWIVALHACFCTLCTSYLATARDYAVFEYSVGRQVSTVLANVRI